MLPTIMQQLGAENMWNLKNLAKTLASTSEELKGANDDDVPQLVENFDEASKNEGTTVNSSATQPANDSSNKDKENTQTAAPTN
jgi:hypothetical protein